MSEIKWEEPPPRATSGRRPSDESAAFRQALIARPGVWAVFCERPNATAGYLRSLGSVIRHSGNAWRGYRWETTARKNGETTKLYVRCLGPMDGDA